MLLVSLIKKLFSLRLCCQLWTVVTVPLVTSAKRPWPKSSKATSPPPATTELTCLSSAHGAQFKAGVFLHRAAVCSHTGCSLYLQCRGAFKGLPTGSSSTGLLCAATQVVVHSHVGCSLYLCSAEEPLRGCLYSPHQVLNLDERLCLPLCEDTSGAGTVPSLPSAFPAL